MAQDLSKYHVTFEDPASGESLGLILDDRGAVGRVARLANPYAAKIGGGDRTLSDLTDMSAYGQTDWRAGRGQDRFDEEDRFYDSNRVETRIKGQATIGPYVGYVGTSATTALSYKPKSAWGVPIGKAGESYQDWGQRFLTPGSGPTCTHVWLKLRKSASGQSHNFTVNLCQDSAGYPGAVLRSKTMDLDSLQTVFQDVKVIWDTSVALAATTYYWITVVDATDAPSATHYMEWAGDDGANGYATGYAAGRNGAWGPPGTAFDFWFSVNDDPAPMTDAITVNPVRFKGEWYWAAGDTVYKWIPAPGYWAAWDTVADQDVTDLEVAGDYIYAARGTSNLRRDSGTGWVDAPGPVAAQLLLCYNGYLYRSDPTTKNRFYYSTDGSSWQQVDVGLTDLSITELTGFRDEVAIATQRSLWLQAADWTYPVLDWSSQEDTANGARMLAWARANELFVPVQHGLYRWTGATMVGMGPDQDAGLPPDRAGNVASLCGTVNWLYAAIDAGDSGYSSILVYQGREWHEIYRSGVAGRRIRAIGYETLSDPPRLWFGEDDAAMYVELPDFTDNPYQYVGVDFSPDGELELSAWGSELLSAAKDWRYVVIQSENCAAKRIIQVYYEIDRSGVWNLIGTVDAAHTLHKLLFPQSSFATKTAGAGCTTTTIELSSGTTADMEPGDWTRISGEYRQVKSITDGDTLVLALPLSAAPASGTKVYAAGPVGSEVRLRCRLVTNDCTQSPKLVGIACFCQANVLDRWQITLDVLVENGMTCLDGSPYPMDAAALETALQTWIARQIPFTLYDLRGNQRTVKVANAVESTPRRSTGPPWAYSSVMHIGLIEAEAGS